MNINNNTSKIITELQHDIDSITSQIASLKLIERNDNKEFGNIDTGSIQFQIKELTNDQAVFKTQLAQAKCELQKAELANEIKLITDRTVSNDADIACYQGEIFMQEASLAELEATLVDLKAISKWENVSTQLTECEASIAKCQEAIAKVKTKRNELSQSIEKNEFKTKILKAQILNLDEMTSLKNKLIDCKTRLKKLQLTQAADSPDSQKAEELLKLEMKGIIKEMIHSKSFLSLQLELRKSRDYLANLEFLLSQNHKVDANEIKCTTRNIELIEKQIEFEITKAKLKDELQTAQLTLLNLSPLLGMTDIEDISKTVNEAALKVIELTNEITKITVQSLAVIKSINDRTVEVLPGIAMETNQNVFSIGMMMGELQKWLSENILQESLGGNIQEAIVSTALLKITKTNSKNLTKTSEAEDVGMTKKVKSLAAGTCEKFLMGQAVEQIATANPIVGAVYAAGVVTQHCLLDDGKLSTFNDKVKKFVIGESIKIAGNLLLGGLVAGTLGSGLAISASTYLAYSIVSSWYSGTTKGDGETDTVADISAAGIEMVADTAVNEIFKNIC